MPFSVATRWPLASRAVATSNERAPSLVVSAPYCVTASGSSVKVHSFTAPRTPCAAPIRAMQIRRASAPPPPPRGAPDPGDADPRRHRLAPSRLLLGGGFGGSLAFLARHGLFRVVA